MWSTSWNKQSPNSVVDSGGISLERENMRMVQLLGNNVTELPVLYQVVRLDETCLMLSMRCLDRDPCTHLTRKDGADPHTPPWTKGGGGGITKYTSHT